MYNEKLLKQCCLKKIELICNNKYSDKEKWLENHQITITCEAEKNDNEIKTYSSGVLDERILPIENMYYDNINRYLNNEYKLIEKSFNALEDKNFIEMSYEEQIRILITTCENWIDCMYLAELSKKLNLFEPPEHYLEILNNLDSKLENIKSYMFHYKSIIYYTFSETKFDISLLARCHKNECSYLIEQMKDEIDWFTTLLIESFRDFRLLKNAINKHNKGAMSKSNKECLKYKNVDGFLFPVSIQNKNNLVLDISDKPRIFFS